MERGRGRRTGGRGTRRVKGEERGAPAPIPPLPSHCSPPRPNPVPNQGARDPHFPAKRGKFSFFWAKSERVGGRVKNGAPPPTSPPPFPFSTSPPFPIYKKKKSWSNFFFPKMGFHSTIAGGGSKDGGGKARLAGEDEFTRRAPPSPRASLLRSFHPLSSNPLAPSPGRKTCCLSFFLFWSSKVGFSKKIGAKPQGGRRWFDRPPGARGGPRRGLKSKIKSFPPKFPPTLFQKNIKITPGSPKANFPNFSKLNQKNLKAFFPLLI